MRNLQLTRPQRLMALALSLLLGASYITPTGPRLSARSGGSPPLAPLVTAKVIHSTGAKKESTPLWAPYIKEFQRPSSIPYPPDNPYSKEREALGRSLFFDPRLSGSSWISCASCHNPSFSWGDGLPRAIGHEMKRLRRRTPTILNLAWAENLFWDGRASSLEEQALGPIQSPGEMNMPLSKMVETVRSISEYEQLFEKAYPNEPISEHTVAKAIANFERGVVSAKAPFDEWLEGNENAISKEAKRGFVVFNTQANCAQCHSGWRFTDDSFHDIGLESDDIGRSKLLPQIASMQHAFKTPTLRNADRRAPFMHDGSETTLQDVIEFYDRGGKVHRPSLSAKIKPLKLSARQKSDLVAFLKTLTSADGPVLVPMLPR